MNRKSIILSIKGLRLSKEEYSLIQNEKPWGIILFKRNIKNINQLKSLTSEIKKAMNDSLYPILIDEEGGRVNRLKKLFDTTVFTGSFFGALYKKNKRKFKLYYKIYSKQISYILKNTGININTVPVLDVRRRNSDNVIGDRSFSYNHKIVSKIGNFCIDEFTKNKIGTIIKHIPGHGLAKVDSHKNTPFVKEKVNILNKKDFYAFKNKKSFFAMTAHIIYQNIDKNFTATHSKEVIKLIKNKIKFKNLLISDDISMKGLKFSIKENTIKAFNAGCDLVLHCNAKYEEMTTVAKNSPKVNAFITKKTSQFYKILR